MRIAVVFNLPSELAKHSPFIATETDTEVSAREVAAALETKGATVSLFAIPPDRLTKIQEISADLIFNLVEWTGLDLPLSLKAFQLLESTGIPIIGATRQNFQLTTDKLLMKKELVKHRLPTGSWQQFKTGRERLDRHLTYPLIVKLALEHCSIGLNHDSIVRTDQELRAVVKDRLTRFKQPVFAEEFLPGREFQVTVIESDQGLLVLPPAEIIYLPSHFQFLTYSSRWEEAHPDYQESNIVLAELDRELASQIKRVCERTFRELSFCDYSRLDLRCRRSGEVMIMEANSNPGLGDDPDYGMTLSYQAFGWTFADFVWKIVESASRRPRL